VQLRAERILHKAHGGIYQTYMVFDAMQLHALHNALLRLSGMVWCHHPLRNSSSLSPG
jgi:hypothetical protein